MRIYFLSEQTVPIESYEVTGQQLWLHAIIAGIVTAIALAVFEWLGYKLVDWYRDWQETHYHDPIEDASEEPEPEPFVPEVDTGILVAREIADAVAAEERREGEVHPIEGDKGRDTESEGSSSESSS